MSINYPLLFYIYIKDYWLPKFCVKFYTEERGEKKNIQIIFFD